MAATNRTMASVPLRAASRPVFPRIHLKVLGGLAVVCLSVFLWRQVFPGPSPGPSPSVPVPREVPRELLRPAEPLPVSVMPQARDTAHEIQQGDTLSGIFSRRGLDYATLNAVLAADQELLALDVLRPGNVLHFERSENSGELLSLSLVVHPGQTIHYRRTVDGLFEFEEEIKPGHWYDEVVSALIHGSFYASAMQAGVSEADIVQVRRILDGRVNFRRDIQAGDWFEIVFGREMVDTGATGRTRIEAIRLHRGRRTHEAFLHADGNYYDAEGNSLGLALRRYPMQGHYRVSSRFNLRRLHPVTGRIAPHHGVDFAMPTGTPVLSTGEGVVTRVGNHPFAGKYLEIRHPGQFKTRYLHLSRIEVRQGQQVARGERVALSGNTGRSTGPHLHFELHINDRPVDPLVADIPTASSVPVAERAAFTQRVTALAAVMQHESMLALHGGADALHTDI